MLPSSYSPSHPKRFGHADNLWMGINGAQSGFEFLFQVGQVYPWLVSS